MKTTLKIFLFLVVAFGFSATANAQTYSEAATATATLVTPLSISKDANLSFGILTSGAAGTITVGHSDNVSVTGGVLNAGGTVTSAQFTVTGENGKAITLSYPASISLSKGSGDPLTVVLSSDTGSTATLATSVPYNKIIKIGGSITLGASTPTGAYSNSTDLKITVNYQ